MGLPASFAPEQLEVAQVLHGAPLDPEADTGPWTLRMPLLHPATSGFSVEAGLALVELPARDGLLDGLALMPYADGALQESFPLDTARNWQLAISGGLDLQGGLAVIARPGQPLRLIADVASGSGAEAAGELDVTLSRLAGAPQIGLVTFGASGLFVTGAHLRLAGLLSSAQSPELLAEIGLDKARLRVATDPNDGFLRTVTSNIDVPFDAGFGFSTRRGGYFVGGAGLELDIPLGVRVGPVEFQQLRAKLAPQASSPAQGAGGPRRPRPRPGLCARPVRGRPQRHRRAPRARAEGRRQPRPGQPRRRLPAAHRRRPRDRNPRRQRQRLPGA